VRLFNLPFRADSRCSCHASNVNVVFSLVNERECMEKGSIESSPNTIYLSCLRTWSSLQIKMAYLIDLKGFACHRPNQLTQCCTKFKPIWSGLCNFSHNFFTHFEFRESYMHVCFPILCLLQVSPQILVEMQACQDMSAKCSKPWKTVILGCHWFKVEWNPSKQLVSAFGESLLISFSMLVFMRISCILSYAFVPKKKKKRLKSYNYTR